MSFSNILARPKSSHGHPQSDTKNITYQRENKPTSLSMIWPDPYKKVNKHLSPMNEEKTTPTSPPKTYNKIPNKPSNSDRSEVSLSARPESLKNVNETSQTPATTTSQPPAFNPRDKITRPESHEVTETIQTPPTTSQPPASNGRNEITKEPGTNHRTARRSTPQYSTKLISPLN